MADTTEPGKLIIPEISRELIRWLRATHPVRPIGPDETLASANRAAGFQECIDLLDFKSQLQAMAEQGELDEDSKEMLVYEAPTKEQQEQGYVLRVS